MPKRSSSKPSKKRPSDINQLAAFVVQTVTENPGKNPAAVLLGHLGGKKGGKARARSLTPEQRKEIARKAAAARWGEKIKS